VKIGIVGAPGAGKSDFAIRLKARLSEELFPESFWIIDDYVQEIQEDTGLALGPWAAHYENYMIAGVRLAAEARLDGEDTITVGTILDSLTYTLILGGIDLSTEYSNDQFMESQTAINGMALLYGQTWDYNMTFYLPLENGVDQLWRKRLDSTLPSVIDSFLVPNAFVLEGTTEERLDIATRLIEEAEKPSEDDGIETPEADG
jgi:hypothetical protein